ncbi:PREDICTED: uncharacterized protein LOC109342416 [Lupinus angustifolius]|uniref:uncharacterized protein LOC109342416 n=1 Tax=Lupinus angustifolius TaxID=3871 RepID=UPI00092F428F|nr:PREDICTED: uncharacterized protein LOC109342416 [Lupinus angustifolius]
MNDHDNLVVAKDLRGFGSLKTRLVLQNFCVTHKPDLVFISEPMIPIVSVSSTFWNSLNLDLFVVNNIGDALPNLWGLCSRGVVPHVLLSTSQFLAISATLDNKVVNVCVVYAHTNYIQRRILWSDALDVISAFSWSLVFCQTLPRSSSDHHPLLFSAYPGSPPLFTPFKFQKMWLLHLDCRRVISEAWRANFSGCPMYILSQKLKLLKKDLRTWNRRVFGNIHHTVNNALSNVDLIQNYIADIGPNPELLEQEDQAQKALSHALGMEESMISFLVSDDENLMLTSVPSHQEIKDAVFGLNGDGAPGPDDFGGCFYQAFWDIVGNDVCCSVTQFFTQGWILPNMNSNSVILIPKNNNAVKIDDYRPIVIANFQFKIITKDRKIQECIRLASEAINLLDHKTFGGNMAIKLDIKKAFDTIDWDFITFTFIAFGFSMHFTNLIKTPCHVLYADDIMIFCKGTKSNLLALKSLIRDYSLASGQHISADKCKFYIKNAPTRKVSNISNYLGFQHGSLPFKYLGVPLFTAQFLNWVDSKMRNFIWSANTEVQKIVTVAWNQVCSPTSFGGLGLKSIKLMNKSALLMLAWDMLSSHHEWASFYRERFGCNKTVPPRYHKSSIWPGIKDNWSMVDMNSRWLAKVVDFIYGFNWVIPVSLLFRFPEIISKTKDIPIANSRDRFIWQESSDGILTAKLAYDSLSHSNSPNHWRNNIWFSSIPPSKSFITWRFLNGKMSTDDNLQKCGCYMGSMCSLCRSNTEGSSHLFLTCPFAIY